MIRFDPNRGQFVLQLPCKISFETVNAFGQLVDELAEGLGEVYVTPQQLQELTAQRMRAASTWCHEDGRNFTIGSLSGQDWQLIWHGRCADNVKDKPFKISASGYREFISARKAEGFKLMPLVSPPPAPPAGRY